MARKVDKLLEVGDAAPDFSLTDHKGDHQKLSSFRGKRVLLSFYRFAACPLCQYNIDRLQKQSAMFENAGIVTLCVFMSTPENVSRYSIAAQSEGNGTIAMSDASGKIFKAYTTKTSYKAAVSGTVKMLMSLKKLNHVFSLSKLLKDTRYGTNVKGMIQLPADFLIDEEGKIVDMHRAARMDDNMPFERLEAFIPEDKRCKCNQKDCIVPRCRKITKRSKRKPNACFIFNMNVWEG